MAPVCAGSARIRQGVLLALLLALFGGALLGHQFYEEAAIVRTHRTFQIMGTVANFTFYGSAEAGESAVAAALRQFERIQQMANLYDPRSELSRLNRCAGERAFVCSDELWLLLSEARQAYEFTGGAFDVTAKPLMDLWGFYRKRGNELPSSEEIVAARARVGLDKVIFDEETQSVHFTVPGMSFDLGGIAKGYAVDAAAEAVAALGVRRGVIDLGGNLRLLPEPPPGEGFYRVGIRNPAHRDELLPEVLELRDASVSTSGDYERFVMIGGRRYGHIMDPATGLPTDFDYSVTVIAPSAMLADWLSTGIFLRGAALAERAEREFPGVNVIITSP